MGLGKKAPINLGLVFSLFRSQNNPSPDKYLIQSSFSNSPKKGVSFGAGRDDIKFVSIF
jgi:hypothetical protein